MDGAWDYMWEVGLEIMLESPMILLMARSSRSPSLQTDSGFTTAGIISTKFWCSLLGEFSGI